MSIVMIVAAPALWYFGHPQWAIGVGAFGAGLLCGLLLALSPRKGW